MRLPIGERRVARCADPAWPRAVRLFCNEPKLSTKEVRVVFVLLLLCLASRTSQPLRPPRQACHRVALSLADRQKEDALTETTDRSPSSTFFQCYQGCGDEHTFSGNRTRRGFAVRFRHCSPRAPSFGCAREPWWTSRWWSCWTAARMKLLRCRRSRTLRKSPSIARYAPLRLLLATTMTT